VQRSGRFCICTGTVVTGCVLPPCPVHSGEKSGIRIQVHAGTVAGTLWLTCSQGRVLQKVCPFSYWTSIFHEDFEALFDQEPADVLVSH